MQDLNALYDADKSDEKVFDRFVLKPVHTIAVTIDPNDIVPADGPPLSRATVAPDCTVTVELAKDEAAK